jgi:plasmid maintenance system antidote protein VapI
MSNTHRRDFWTEVGKTQQEIAENLGADRTVVNRIMSGERGMSPELARKLAKKTGKPAPTLYLKSQLASFEHKAATKSMSEAGFLGSSQHVMRNVTKSFYDHELKAARADPEFVSAAKRLKEMLLKALDLLEDGDAGSGNDAGPVFTTGDSVAPALKSRDAHGKAIEDSGEKIERDAYGRRLGR